MSGLTCSREPNSKHREGHQSAFGPVEGRGVVAELEGSSTACTHPVNTRRRNCGKEREWWANRWGDRCKHLIFFSSSAIKFYSYLLSYWNQAWVHVSTWHQLDSCQISEESVLSLHKHIAVHSNSTSYWFQWKDVFLRVLVFTLLSNKPSGLTLRLKVIAACSREANRQWCWTRG